MACSNDAGLAAAETALEVERSVLDTKAVDAVGTTGIFEIKPNAINSVPRDAMLGIGGCWQARCSVSSDLCPCPQSPVMTRTCLGL